ncbi:hypothetical protein LVJ94_35185 [Pendulispora rubella]|uniref:Uncharacterized protein n=1 Tax=Pendulispora rubella TaxID=2741070 RepID=A0ABZ2KUF4_9BACT
MSWTAQGEQEGAPLGAMLAYGLLTLAVLLYVVVRAVRSQLPRREAKDVHAFAAQYGLTNVSASPQYPELRGTVDGVDLVIRSFAYVPGVSNAFAEIAAEADPWPHRVVARYPYFAREDNSPLDLPACRTGDRPFDDQFLVRASSAEGAALLLTPSTRRALLDLPAVMEFIDEGATLRVLIAWSSSFIPVSTIEPACRLLIALARRSGPSTPSAVPSLGDNDDFRR